MVRNYTQNVDYITGFDYSADKQTLVATRYASSQLRWLIDSADGNLAVYDIRKNKAVAVSENQDDELLSLCILKGEKKVAVGTQEGVLELFSWGDWGDCTDRFLGHPCSIDKMLKIDESTICTGTSDGRLRLMSVQPNKFVKILGEHEDEFPIEGLDLHTRLPWIASASSQEIRFWNTQETTENEASDSSETEKEESGDSDSDSDQQAAAKRRKKRRVNQRNFDTEYSKSRFFSGID
jgi:WD40 repeat protein